MGNISGIYFMEYNTSNFLYKKECGYILYISCVCATRQNYGVKSRYIVDDGLSIHYPTRKDSLS